MTAARRREAIWRRGAAMPLALQASTCPDLRGGDAQGRHVEQAESRQGRRPHRGLYEAVAIRGDRIGLDLSPSWLRAPRRK